jgi:hypothetical protein
MKKTLPILNFLAVTFLAITFFSCKKDNSDLLSGRSADLVELIKQSAGHSSGGFVHLAEEVARLATTTELSCNNHLDTTLRSASAPGLVNYTYDVSLRREMICVSGASTRLSFPLQGTHTIENMRLRNEAYAYMSNTIEGTDPSDNNWHFTTSLRRTGTVYSKLSGQSFDHTTTLSSDNLMIEKASSKITGGTAQVEIQYEEGDDPVIVLNGAITFHGNNRATIQFEGRNYQLYW